MTARKRIVVADDNEHNRELAKQILDDGYDVSLAPNGAVALDLFRLGAPDLLIVDLAMPVVDGWAVVRSVRADPAHRTLPIVACTAHAMSGDRERALAAGFDGYLAKPYRVRELLECVERFLGPGIPSPDGKDEWSLAEGGT